MTLDDIFVFALVTLAANTAALAWLTFSLRRRVIATAGQCERFERRFVTIGIKLGELVARLVVVQKASPVNLAAEVVSLGEAVARLRATHQKFQGRFDQYMGQGGGARDDVEPEDPRWRALMDAQIGNGKANGGT